MAASVSSGNSPILTPRSEESKRPDPRISSVAAKKASVVAQTIFVEIVGIGEYVDSETQKLTKVVGIKALQKRTPTNLDYLLSILNKLRAGLFTVNAQGQIFLHVIDDFQNKCVIQGIKHIGWSGDGEKLSIIDGEAIFKPMSIENYKTFSTKILTGK